MEAHSNSPAYALYNVHFTPILTLIYTLATGLHKAISFVAPGAIPCDKKIIHNYLTKVNTASPTS